MRTPSHRSTPSRWTSTCVLSSLLLVPACRSDADGPARDTSEVAEGNVTTGDPTGVTTGVTTGDTTSETGVAASGPPTPAAGSLYAAGDVDVGLAPWVEVATADLAVRLGVAPGELTTIAAVLVVWPDSSLGCPEPDMQYATVLTDGAVIELALGDAVYRYHAGGNRGPFLCERPIAIPPQRL